MRDLAVSNLRCEYLVNPLGLDEFAPRLSWTIESNRRGARQTAYHLRVASSAEQLAAKASDLWDSGRVESNQTTHIAYTGQPLKSRDACHWCVEIWDEAGNSAKSEPALWTMGLLEKSDWSATWIAAHPEIIKRDPEAITPTLTEPGTPALFRREFDVPSPIKRAMLYASARGIFELRANGQRIGKDIFAPEWTDYDKRIHYRTYDVTALLKTGRNALGAMLGDGWWSGYVGWQETRARYGSLENSLIVQLELELTDGQRLTVATDNSWTCNTGPILFSDFMMGETCDARRDRGGWDLPDFGRSAAAGSAGWQPAVSPTGSRQAREGRGIADYQSATQQTDSLRYNWLAAREVAAPTVPLVAQRSEPGRVMEQLTPVSVHEIKPGVFIFNLGQNIAGWVRLKVNAPAGTRVTIRYGERLSPDGTLYTENLRRAKATDVYVCKGGGGHPACRRAGASSPAEMASQNSSVVEKSKATSGQQGCRPLRQTGMPDAVEISGAEIYEPHFTFHGFQYIEITGLPYKPGKDTVTGCVVRSATPDAGQFECSHPGVNRLWLNGLWSQKDNFLSVPTDCPQRDERLGWMGDAQVFCRTASYNMEVAAFFTKWMIDVEDAQTPEGVFPDVAPRLREGENYVGLGNLGGGAGWADAGVIIPYTMWRVYGDRRILERHYCAMVKWVDWIAKHNPNGLRVKQLANNYGDWLCIPSDTSFGTHSPMKNLLATAYWADDCTKLARIARELGHDADAARFQQMFEHVRAAFQKEWVEPNGRITTDTQTGYLLALAFDLLPEQLRAAAVHHLVANIQALNWHLSTGFIGISHLNPQLTLANRPDVAYRLLLQETYPSWLYPVKHGATTIWERWNGWTHEEGFFNPHMNSFNHYSLGSVGEWLFRHVAGIELDPDVPGFQKFILKPYVSATRAITPAPPPKKEGAGERRSDVLPDQIPSPQPSPRLGGETETALATADEVANSTGAGLDFVRASYRTMHGEISSEWKRTGKQLNWTIRIPANTTARVFVPSEANSAVSEGGKPVEQAAGLRVVGRDGDFLLCEAVAGLYRFASRVE
ncbi:MAG TPA: family 78 glycoside hydrolase catalytic domain [Verrucomicrobiota bacterium]|nr:family 78 glycoside hydrolase catalytic domain [Verrucomicrobiota bacterium]